MRSASDSGAARSEQFRARDLLHALSWRAEKLHRQRGHLRSYLWVTEDARGQRDWFETGCEADPREVSDADALAALRAELRADFAREGVVRYGVAFAASAVTVTRPSILHLEAEQMKHSVVALELHDGDLHLRAHRAVAGARLTALTSIEHAPGCFADMC